MYNYMGYIVSETMWEVSVFFRLLKGMQNCRGEGQQQVPQGWLALYTQVGKQQLLVPYISPQIPLVMYSFTDFIVAIGYPQCHALTSFQCPMSTSWDEAYQTESDP